MGAKGCQLTRLFIYFVIEKGTCVVYDCKPVCTIKSVQNIIHKFCTVSRPHDPSVQMCWIQTQSDFPIGIFHTDKTVQPLY